jgi:hypothetical protein
LQKTRLPFLAVTTPTRCMARAREIVLAFDNKKAALSAAAFE